MNCFLIDFENVKSSGLKGIEYLVENDDVYIFYSEYANTITFDVHHKINKSNANLKFFKSDIVGKNALDFQLISYLGYLIAQKKYKNYFVITGDRGFESAVSFWKDFFKQNQFTDLSINRFYNIQDALDKKSIPSKYYNNKKLPPTIPTVETEIELRQLKASNVIVDRNSAKMENHIDKDLSTNNIGAKSTKISLEDSSTLLDEKTPIQEHINKVKNANKYNDDSQQSILREKSTIVDSSENRQSQNVKNSNNNNKKNGNNNKSQNVNANKEKSNKVKQSKDDKSKNKNNNQGNANNKKAFNNQQQNKNNGNNKKNNNKSKNNTSKVVKNPTDNVKKIENLSNEVLNDNNSISNVNASTNEVSNTQKSKGFVFGKVDINDNTSVVENIQKKPSEKTSKNNANVQSTAKKEVVIKTIDLVENIALKNIDTKEKVSMPVEAISDGNTKKINTNSDTLIKKDVNININNNIEKESSISIKSNEPKRKVGRPRIKPLKDQKEKPKNNKKFQEDIPNEKLEKMLDKVSQLLKSVECPTDDKIKVCKIVAFCESKQEGYQAFMSCFGKHKGVEIYKIVKQEFDALKNLYLNN